MSKKPTTMAERARSLAQEMVLFGHLKGYQWDGLKACLITFALSEIARASDDALLSAHEAAQPDRAIGIPDVQALSTLAHDAEPQNQIVALIPGRVSDDQFIAAAHKLAHEAATPAAKLRCPRCSSTEIDVTIERHTCLRCGAFGWPSLNSFCIPASAEAAPVEREQEPIIHAGAAGPSGITLCGVRGGTTGLDSTVTCRKCWERWQAGAIYPPGPSMPDGSELIAIERKRQVTKERWTAQHDDKHRSGDLVTAAMCYGVHASHQTRGGPTFDQEDVIRSRWPWEPIWWKPSADPIRNLVKAGALIAAEIDRLQRLPALPPSTERPK